MTININLDEKAVSEIEELAKSLKISKSKLIREAINDFYLKEKRAKENLSFFIDMYNNGIVGKDMLFLLLPKADAEAIIIGSKMGKRTIKIAKNFDN